MTVLNLGVGVTNNYLIPVGEDYLLIDTGYKNEYGKFLTALKKAGIPLEKIKYLVLTHAHADHAGFAKALLNDTNATLIYNEKAKARLEAGKNNMDVYVSSFTNLMLSKLSVTFVHKTQVYPAVFYDKVLSPKTQALSDFGIEFMELAGHTDADLAVKYNGRLFIGDIAMSRFPASRRFPMWLENKFELLKSWDKILQTEGVDELYPGHGKPFPKSDLAKKAEFWRDKGVLKLFKK